MKGSEVLLAARGLIEHEENWLQGCLGRDGHGHIVDPGHESATRFCALGALHGATRTDGSLHGGSRPFTQMERAARDLGSNNIVDFNNTRSHAEVLGLFNEAIRRAIEIETPLEPIPAVTTGHGVAVASEV